MLSCGFWLGVMGLLCPFEMDTLPREDNFWHLMLTAGQTTVKMAEGPPVRSLAANSQLSEPQKTIFEENISSGDYYCLGSLFGSTVSLS